MRLPIANCDPAVQGCIESCKRLLVVLGAITPAQFQQRWNGHNGIGPHTRHCIEHLAGLRDGLASGLVNYDARARDRHLEEDPVACAEIIEGLADWLSWLDAAALDQAVTVAQIPQVDAAPIHSQSSLRRELLFVTSHTIHHLAVVSMLAEIHDISLPDRLGLAYSTQAYERAQSAQSRGASAPPS